ncbi:MAG: hypothetical protein R3F17_03890 [Planctomycetota bacterium]
MLVVPRFPLICLMVWMLSCGGFAQEASTPVRADQMPRQLNGVRISEKFGDQVPGDLHFRDLEDQDLLLGSLFQGDKPILLTLNYATCPQLCGLQLRGLAQALGSLSMNPGEDYQMITVGLDPNEMAEQTKAVKGGFMNAFGRPVNGDAWHFLRGGDGHPCGRQCGGL